MSRAPCEPRSAAGGGIAYSFLGELSSTPSGGHISISVEGGNRPALRAMLSGESGGRVTVSIVRNETGPEQGIDVTFSDYGPGIPEEHIPRITERFYRVDVENSRTQKGTGLGLSIVKHILTRHNARLSIKSEVGKGAAFTVHLPAR